MRPAENPQRGVDHDLDAHLDRLERQYRQERDANRAMRFAVIDFGRRMRIVVWSLIAGGAAIVAVGAYLINRNREAIRVSCTLLTNAIIESGGGGSGQHPSSPAAKAQRESTGILIAAIARGLLTGTERAELARLQGIVDRAGGVVSIPDCEDIASDPGRVRELLLDGKGEPVRRSPPARP